MSDLDYATVLSCWFGSLDALGRADEIHAARWFASDPEFDAWLRERFAPVHTAAVSGALAHWLEHPRGLLAYVIVLDQFSRNLFRGTARMFAYDGLALAAAERGLGVQQMLAFDELMFLYLPFTHAEDAAVQERGVELYRKLVVGARAELMESATSGLTFALRHRDIVCRFGRFPHRNTALGRVSTRQELEFLAQPNSSF